jgi:crotonobetainyl-CoA:carnitine CoA-transferase CaiB-like acyl-CoA transferase
MILAQLGAEVIKVEPPTGDNTRKLRGMATAFFPLFNRGKRSLVLDLKSEAGRAALERLLATADVFIENFRDETIAKSGLDSKALAQRFPMLIIGAHKGYLSGPYEHRPALDEVVQMATGLAYMTGSRETPLRVGSSINDIMGGMFGVIGILAALIERQKTQRGKEIRVGLFENCLFTVAQHMVQYQITGVPAAPMPQRSQSWPVYDIFDTADARRVFVAIVTESNWTALCTNLALEELLSDPTLKSTPDRIEARPRILPLIRERFGGFVLADLERLLDALSIPFAPINAPEEMFDDPHVQRPGGLVDMVNVDGRTVRAPALPLEFDRIGLVDPTVVPVLGADTENILNELGLTPDAASAARGSS